MTRENRKYQFYREALLQLSLFKEVGDEAVTDLMYFATPRSWTRKSCILDTNNTLNTFYIILSGRLKAYQFRPDLNRQLTLFLLTRGDVFDVCSMIKGKAHEVYYEALGPTEVLCVPMHLLKEWIRRNPSFYRNLLEYTIAKMSRLENYLTDLIMEDTCKRLAILLYNHMNPVSREVEVLNGLSHTELAALIGTTRTVVGRHILSFKEEGILKFSHQRIEITDLERLQELLK